MSRHRLTERIWFGLKSEIAFIKMGCLMSSEKSNLLSKLHFAIHENL